MQKLFNEPNAKYTWAARVNGDTVALNDAIEGDTAFRAVAAKADGRARARHACAESD